MNETIFALATPFGRGSTSLIRISGIQAITAMDKLHKKPITMKPRYCHLLEICDQNGDFLDKIIAIYFESPNSFTGEDVIELHVHGNPLIVRKIINMLSTMEGFRHAYGGEFSKRAFLNGKIDLTEAESINDLINANSDRQLKQALDQLSGRHKEQYLSWRNQIIEILSLVEASIDFSDEDLPEYLAKQCHEKIQALAQQIEMLLDNKKLGEIIRDGFRISIVGPPNSGKSTLINHLAKQEIAIVSDIAGTTRDIIDAKVSIGGHYVIFYDTAGIRENSEDPIERQGIIRAKQNLRQADLSLLLMDLNEPSCKDNILNIAKLINKDKCILVQTKADLIKNSNQINLNEFDELREIKHKISISVHDEFQIDQLLDMIIYYIKIIDQYEPSLLINQERHRFHLTRLIEIIQTIDINEPIEIQALKLRIAANELSSITGSIHNEEILDQIFNNFCIGK